MLATKWKDTGIYLDVPVHQLNAIEANYHGHPNMVQNCLREMFSWWLNNEESDGVTLAKKLAEVVHAVDEHGVEAGTKKVFGKVEETQ